MADILVKVRYSGGGMERITFPNITPAAAKTAIEQAKADGTLLQIGVKLINIDNVGSVELIER